jgi:hypothetical protein
MMIKKIMESREKVEKVFNEHEKLKMSLQVAITLGVYYLIMEFVVMKIIYRVPIQIGFF